MLNQPFGKDKPDYRKIILGILVLLVLGIGWLRDGKTPTPTPPPPPVPDQPLTYKGKELILTHHAQCRMDCRSISMDDVREVLENGKINPKKSDPNDSPCPTDAIEGMTRDEQSVRIIVADCPTEAKLVTVIDLKKDWECVCD